MTSAPEISAEELARALELYLAEHPAAALLEDGKTLFQMDRAKYALDLQHGRCVLQVWNEERNIVRRVTGMRARKQALLLETQRMGQPKPGMMELSEAQSRRAPSERKLERSRYLRVLQRAAQRQFGDWKLDELKAAQDLEHSFGPAYVRGQMTRGNRAMAVVSVGPLESRDTVDGILTLGVLWLARLRETAGPRKVVEGVRLIVPAGMAGATAARLAWMDTRQAKWELWELDATSEDLTPIDADAGGNLATRLLRAPDEKRVRERFATEIAHIVTLAPECDVRVLNTAEISFALHGLVFARARVDADAASFARTNRLTFGAGVNETPLTEETAALFQSLIARLRASRHTGGGVADPLFRMQAEAWLESQIRQDVAALDSELQAQPVYSQRSAFAGAEERGVPDLLARTRDGRLAVIELKAHEDMHLAMQGLDYWMRVRQLHLGSAESQFTRMGYFPGEQLAQVDPELLLVAPALRVHPAVEAVLRHLSPRVSWQLIAVDERWRGAVKVVWRKRSGEKPPAPGKADSFA
jgi:hypothetical protein